MNCNLDKTSLRLLGALVAAVCCSCAAVATANDSTVRIALVADPHVSLESRYAQYNANFETVIREVNAANVDAVLVAGDLTNHGRPDEFERYVRMLKGFEAPVVSVAGNHDVGNRVMAGKGTTLSDRRLDAYREYVGPLFDSVAVAANCRVVYVTSSLLGSGLAREQDQWEFLQRQLPSRDGERVIVLMHYPLFVRDIGEGDDYMNLAPEARLRLLEIVRQSGVKLLLSGHQHLPMDQQYEGVRMIGAPAVSFGLPEGEQSAGWALLTCFADGKVDLQLHDIQPETPVARATAVGGR